MTQHRRLKSKVRARMAKTGQSYATARMHVLGEGNGSGTPGSPSNDNRSQRPVPFAFVDGRTVVHEVAEPLPARQQMKHPAGPGLAQASAGIRGEFVVDFELMKDGAGAPVYVQIGAPITNAAVTTLVNGVRPSFMDFANTFTMADAQLSTLISPDGWYWIEFSWKSRAGFCRVSSGWITPDHPGRIHRMAFVERVVDQMNLLVFSAGSNPAPEISSRVVDRGLIKRRSFQPSSTPRS
jgi:hypothetical protein